MTTRTIREKLDYGSYRDIYGGRLDEERFVSGVSAALETLTALIYPLSPSDMDGEQTEAFLCAVAAQLDFEAGSSYRGKVRSESLGDRSVTYEKGPTGIFVLGKPVSPNAASILRSGRCLGRWI